MHHEPLRELHQGRAGAARGDAAEAARSMLAREQERLHLLVFMLQLVINLRHLTPNILPSKIPVRLSYLIKARPKILLFHKDTGAKSRSSEERRGAEGAQAAVQPLPGLGRGKARDSLHPKRLSGSKAQSTQFASFVLPRKSICRSLHAVPWTGWQGKQILLCSSFGSSSTAQRCFVVAQRERHCRARQELGENSTALRSGSSFHARRPCTFLG